MCINQTFNPEGARGWHRQGWQRRRGVGEGGGQTPAPAEAGISGVPVPQTPTLSSISNQPTTYQANYCAQTQYMTRHSIYHLVSQTLCYFPPASISTSGKYLKCRRYRKKENVHRVNVKTELSVNNNFVKRVWYKWYLDCSGRS